MLPPLFPLLKGAFGVGYAELSIIMSLMYATSGLMQTPAGLLVDRLGPAWVLSGGLGLYSVTVVPSGARYAGTMGEFYLPKSPIG